MGKVYKQWEMGKNYEMCKTRYHNDRIYCYLERENGHVLKISYE